MTPAGKDYFRDLATGDPFGAVAAYEGRPFPASAVALEETVASLTPRQAFFSLLEQHPSLVRGLLFGLTQRLVELTNRLDGVEWRARRSADRRLFPSSAKTSGAPRPEGSRSRWHCRDRSSPTSPARHRDLHPHHEPLGQGGIVRTEKDGFCSSQDALEELAAT